MLVIRKIGAILLVHMLILPAVPTLSDAAGVAEDELSIIGRVLVDSECGLIVVAW